MGFNDINLQVSGPQQPASTYKTKVLKGQVPFATQVTEPNTKYVIKHNFVLDGDVTIPANCVLQFDGGSLNNGTINLNGCYINAGLNQIFNDVKLNSINTYNGTLEVIDNIYIKTLSANAFVNKKTNKLVPANTVINRRYIYKVTGSSSSTTIEGSSVKVTINNTTYTVAQVTADNKYELSYEYTRVIGIVAATGEMASGIVDSLDGITFYSIDIVTYSSNSQVYNETIYPEWFGAKGDNINDDSIALNSALDLCYYSKSKVVLGSKIYRIDDTLIVHTNIRFEGTTPIIEYPIGGCLSVNTDIGILVFDGVNPAGSYVINNIGFKPYSEIQNFNYIGIKIYHSQNHANISNVGFIFPAIGVYVYAIGGVQMLRCEDLNLWSENNHNVVAIKSVVALSGWFNANYFRFGCVSGATGVDFTRGVDNTLDGGNGYCEGGGHDWLIKLNSSQLYVKGGLYKETGYIAQIRNNSILKFVGDSYFIGEIDNDETSCVYYSSPNLVGGRTNYIVNNVVLDKSIIFAHYCRFKPYPYFWHETISDTVDTPRESYAGYSYKEFNGRIFTKGYCKVRISMTGINIKNKTIALRVLGVPSEFPASGTTNWPLIINADFTDGSTVGFHINHYLDNVAGLYKDGSTTPMTVERGERFIFIYSPEVDYLLYNILIDGNGGFYVSDIYIIDLPLSDIDGNENRTKKIKIIETLKSLDKYINTNKLYIGYNKGNSGQRPTSILTVDDTGFEYYDTTLNKPIYYNGNGGWVDATGATV